MFTQICKIMKLLFQTKSYYFWFLKDFIKPSDIVKKLLFYLLTTQPILSDFLQVS